MGNLACEPLGGYLRVMEALDIETSFYGLPKVHKQGCALQPIVNTIGLLTYFVSTYLGGLLKPHVRKSEAYMENSVALIPVLDSLVLAQTFSRV